MRVHSLWAIVAALAMAPVGGCRSVARCQPAADHSVVACIGEEPVRRQEAQEFLETPQWVPGSATLQDPRPVAVDKAIDLRLLASEAKRRGLTAPQGTAALAQALLADEAAKRGIARDKVSEDEAHKYFDAYPESFGQIDSVRAQAVVVADPKLAESIYKEAVGADEERFAQLVAKYSEDAASKAKRGELPPIHASKEADRELLTLALSLRRAGALGGPVKAADGRYYVVRILAADVTRVTMFDEGSLAKARNILVFQRTQAMAAELAASLRKSTVIRVFDDAVAALEPPTASAATPPSSH